MNYLETVACDFEVSLVNAIKSIFPNVRRIGCFYHFLAAIRRWLLGNDSSKDKNIIIYNIISVISSLPFTNPNDILDIPVIICSFNYLDNNSNVFEAYFHIQWMPYFENGDLFSNLEPKVKSNSIIEAFNNSFVSDVGQKGLISWYTLIKIIKDDAKFH